jgi:hypothetical protein
MEEVSCSDQFSEGQLLGLELAIEIRAIVLRAKQAGGWRLEEYGWLPRIILKTSSSLRVFASPRELWLFESPRKADFQPASAEAPRPRRKNRLRSRISRASIAQKRHDFGALPCSKRSLQSCAEQNHPRENIGEIAKEKNRVHFDSDAQRIAYLLRWTHSIARRCQPTLLRPGPWSLTALADCR